ncbi:unnamed protein product [Vitrella brassicaformis CCMP3155]|uniref:Protein kinase domain-containing protein n=1 Tax=Vitrella brassicaformis (strain CCMP3155) TaxID=1169540 RepID=A0A0G4GX72_VITBC|nr:unnamed protein product [Vitrella brassicaformis CCMP3155]|eukprot:CEM35667.1 unnamed protein product [Vitrella brassicaformis CCMP3155]
MLTGFVLCTSIENPQSILRDGIVLMGTPCYKAPELYDGQFDARSDLFACGSHSDVTVTPEMERRFPGVSSLVPLLLAKDPASRTQSARHAPLNCWS